MSNPNSWLSVEVINQTGADITNVNLKHRYDTDHYDEKTWADIKNEARAGGLQVGFWTGFGRTGYDYWQIFFNCEGETFTCKDNFYCYLTKDDAKSEGVVQIKLTLSKMYVEPPKSSSAYVSLSKIEIAMANRDKGFYNIAHMVNTKDAIEWAISKRANGLEADLNFDKAGNPTVYKHGGYVSDCTCNPS